ncbi:hypothetical protein EJ03DRAFT_334552 [Teratosphaeria nubilosa]|uniref:Uncharacterized protein n=1 Tax=Teratosphaeria nubilosa TaxID=161662 RepID=A0A6G1LGM4_9PEZI|nr:hypothetical protein EJ03DRAFT_334552 [Teratosphaeria nubilosa]
MDPFRGNEQNRMDNGKRPITTDDELEMGAQPFKRQRLDQGDAIRYDQAWMIDGAGADNEAASTNTDDVLLASTFDTSDTLGFQGLPQELVFQDDDEGSGFGDSFDPNHPVWQDLFSSPADLPTVQHPFAQSGHQPFGFQPQGGQIQAHQHQPQDQAGQYPQAVQNHFAQPQQQQAGFQAQAGHPQAYQPPVQPQAPPAAVIAYPPPLLPQTVAAQPGHQFVPVQPAPVAPMQPAELPPAQAQPAAQPLQQQRQNFGTSERARLPQCRIGVMKRAAYLLNHSVRGEPIMREMRNGWDYYHIAAADLIPRAILP